MKTSLAVAADSQAEIAAADVTKQIKTLFERCPNLCGFVVEDPTQFHCDANPRDVEGRLVITQVSFAPQLPRNEAHQVFRLIVDLVSELAAAGPETSELLCGRTFARTLH